MAKSWRYLNSRSHSPFHDRAARILRDTDPAMSCGLLTPHIQHGHGPSIGANPLHYTPLVSWQNTPNRSLPTPLGGELFIRHDSNPGTFSDEVLVLGIVIPPGPPKDWQTITVVQIGAALGAAGGNQTYDDYASNIDGWGAEFCSKLIDIYQTNSPNGTVATGTATINVLYPDEGHISPYTRLFLNWLEDATNAYVSRLGAAVSHPIGANGLCYERTVGLHK
jgi:hypothetical protein